MSRRTDRPSAASSPLPDFCGLPALVALGVVGVLTVLVMWLAPAGTRSWRALSVAMAFVAWLTVLLLVGLCKFSPWLRRWPGRWPYGGVWLTMVAITVLASAVAAWLDHALALGFIVDAAAFVRDDALLAALLGAALLRYFFLLAQWQERLRAVAHAQVAALQARIRPHFLFNSMNTVAALVRTDPDAAERTVEDLAELFRAALGADAAGEGTLGEELALIDRYLAIEQLRLGPRLRVRREFAALPAAAPLPCLLLQPLVENAVRHGIQPLRSGGEVGLRGWREGTAYVIEVTNPRPESAPSAGTGHGLASVRQRVAFHYGASARVEAVAEAGRFVVRLSLPLAAGETTHARADRR